jgi:peptide/nickel transport system ATP-binding protein
MLQRVMIAMALSCQPKLLIADEPTTALDVTVQAQILRLLRDRARASQMAMMLITHDLGVIAQMAEQVVVMYAGRIVEQGATAEVLRHPQHPLYAGLIASRPVPGERRRRLYSIPGQVPDLAALPAGCAFAGRCERATRAAGRRFRRCSASASGPPAFTANLRRRQHEHRYVIEVDGLKKYFPLRDGLFGQQTGELRAVDGVSFNIRPGTIFGLVGESGSGKTTVGRTLLGLYEKSAGSVKFHGQELADLTAPALRAIRPRMQLVFQDPYSSLNPRLRIGDAIGEAMLQHKLCTRDELYDRVIAVMHLRPAPRAITAFTVFRRPAPADRYCPGADLNRILSLPMSPSRPRCVDSGADHQSVFRSARRSWGHVFVYLPTSGWWNISAMTWR